MVVDDCTHFINSFNSEALESSSSSSLRELQVDGLEASDGGVSAQVGGLAPLIAPARYLGVAEPEVEEATRQTEGLQGVQD